MNVSASSDTRVGITSGLTVMASFVFRTGDVPELHSKSILAAERLKAARLALLGRTTDMLTSNLREAVF